MEKKALISIIMPCYNSEKHIMESTKSVIKQTYDKWELIIVDDCSTDSSREILNKIKDPRVKLIFLNENVGAGTARNKAIEHARGKYIAFLDADDIWLPAKLEKQIQFMQDNNYVFTYTKYQMFKTGEQKGKIINPSLTTNYKKILYGNDIGCLTVVYDADELGKHFMPSIRKRQDLGLWVELLKITPQAYCLPEVLAYYRTDSGMSKNKFSAAKYQWLFYRNVMNFGILSSSRYFFIYSIKGFLKHYI